MSARLTTLAVGALLALTTSPAFADVPRLINFQGRLADHSGTPLSGYFSMTFKILDAQTAGTPCFAETQTAVRVNGGLFSVAVGSVPDGGIGYTCDFSKPYFLELMVGNDAPMSPRIPLTAAAYALAAAGVVGLDSTAGVVRTHYLGAGAGQIPLNNGLLNSTLNADKLDGHHWDEYLTQVSKPLYQENSNCSLLLSALATCSSYKDSCSSYPAVPSGCTNVSTVRVASSMCCDSYGSCPQVYRRNYSCPNVFIGFLRAPCTDASECPASKPTCNAGVCQ